MILYKFSEIFFSPLKVLFTLPQKGQQLIPTSLLRLWGCSYLSHFWVVTSLVKRKKHFSKVLNKLGDFSFPCADTISGCWGYCWSNLKEFKIILHYGFWTISIKVAGFFSFVLSIFPWREQISVKRD